MRDRWKGIICIAGERARGRITLGTAVVLVQAATFAAAWFVASDYRARLTSGEVPGWLIPWLAVVTLLGAGTAGTAIIARVYGRTLELRHKALSKRYDDQVDRMTATRDALIFGLAKLADYRDSDTGKHLERIASYSALLAEAYTRPEGRDEPEIDEAYIRCLRLASSLHDIGKVGIPDSILLKPGRFTPEERALMEQHPLIGADTLIAIREKLGDDELINMGLAIALEHHERWDGSGYPFGLHEDQIDLSARIVALADFYDALTSERVYKAAASHEETRQLILDARGKHFDPALVDAFESIHHRFAEARENMKPVLDPEVTHAERMSRALERLTNGSNRAQDNEGVQRRLAETADEDRSPPAEAA
ncbi:MAG: HD domain-containing phosphohydrolase [Planctomycetota bacterium]